MTTRHTERGGTMLGRRHEKRVTTRKVNLHAYVERGNCARPEAREEGHDEGGESAQAMRTLRVGLSTFGNFPPPNVQPPLKFPLTDNSD